MKKILFIIAGSIAFISIIISIIFFSTAGINNIATAFFTEIKAKNYNEAYSYLSKGFKANSSQQQLLQFLEYNTLLKFKKASWNSRTISGNNGQLSGFISTEAKDSIPVKINFVKEDNKWKIHHISRLQ